MIEVDIDIIWHWLR